MNGIVRNNTGLLGKKDVIDGFVANRRVLDIILLELRGSSYNGPLQCYLVIGENGVGKTMLLWRIKYAIEDDLELSNLIVPVMFKEEQYFLGDLETLWNYVVSQIESLPLSEKKDPGYSVEILFEKASEESAYYKLEKKLKERGKKVILFIENLDTFFRKIGKHGQQRLREVLSTSRDIRIIGSATALFNEVTNYHLPFYEYFKVVQLKGLNRKEAEYMYAKIIEPSLKSEKGEQISKRYSARIEALRRITKGNPRLMGYIYQSMQNGSNNGVDDICLLLDLLTLRYKTEMEQMPYQQQRVIDYIAGRLDAVPVKDIVHGTGMESKYISSILNALRKNKVVDKVETDSKNHLYRLHDFLFNMWYNQRYGNMAEETALNGLVRFFEVWIGIVDRDGDTEAAISSGSTAIQFPELANLGDFNVPRSDGSYETGTAPMACEEDLQKISNRRFEEPYMAVVYASQVVDQGYFECPCHLLAAHEDKIAFVMNGANEADKQKLVRELISFFIKLLTKNQYNWAMQLFTKGKETFRVWLRPIYFACLRLLKEAYPTDVLKSAPALDSTIQEILEEIKRA